MNIEDIAKRMALTIPAPHKKPIKKAMSWRTLKPGQYLLSVVPFTLNGRVAPVNTMWHVSAVDSSGCDIESVGLKPLHFHWTVPVWKDKYFTRVRKPSKSTLLDLLIKDL